MNEIKKNKYYLIFFLLIGILVYLPKFSNGFVIDDYVFFINNPQMHNFNFSILFDNIYVSESIYRLTSAIIFSLLYTLFGANALPYHILQIFLHVVVCLLLFFYFKIFFRKNIAFFATSIYLIHPINAEAVLWISSMQSQFAMIPGLLALLFAIKKRIPQNYLFKLTLLLTLSLISYEIGFIFMVLLLLYTAIFRKELFKKSLEASLLSTTLYIVLRFFGGATTYYVYETFPIGELSLLERLQMIPAILSFYIERVLLPVNLQVWQIWTFKTISITNFFLPLANIIFFFSVIGFSLMRLCREQEKYFKLFSFFFLWFVIGIVPYLQIFPLEFTVSERWFYLSFVGMLGMMSILISVYKKYVLKYSLLFLSVFILVSGILAYRTFIRAYDWKNNLTLYYNDLQLDKNNEALLYGVWAEFYKNNNFIEAVKYQEKLLTFYPMSYAHYTNFGNSYKMIGEFDKAIIMYRSAINMIEKPDDNTFEEPYLHLAQIYTITSRPKDVIALLNDSLLYSQNKTAELFMYKALAELEVGEYEKALKYAEFLYKNSPGRESSNFYKLITDRIAKER